jgi:hypothetical protein
MEEGASETGDVAIGKALALTVVLSVCIGVISGLLGMLGVLDNPQLSDIVMLALAAILLGGVMIARGGTLWPLRLGWLALLAAFSPPIRAWACSRAGS